MPDEKAQKYISRVKFTDFSLNRGARIIARVSGGRIFPINFTNEGKNSFAIATGIKSKAKGKLGCYIAVAEWENINGEWQIKNFKAHKVDGKTIKEDTFYMLKNGKFVMEK